MDPCVLLAKALRQAIIKRRLEISNLGGNLVVEQIANNGSDPVEASRFQLGVSKQASMYAPGKYEIAAHITVYEELDVTLVIRHPSRRWRADFNAGDPLVIDKIIGAICGHRLAPDTFEGLKWA